MSLTEEGSPQSKRCARCSETKARSEFYAAKSSPDGLNYWCKECKKAGQRERYWSAKTSGPSRKSPSRPSRNPERNDFRDRHAERLYRAMLNAPPGAVSKVMLDRAGRVVRLLGDLAELDPETAATQMPAVRCRQFSGTREFGEWWAKFADACEARRATETPQLGHLRTRSKTQSAVVGP